MAIINTMEEIVRSKIDELILTNDCCRCEKCREDAECLALNSLPPKYVSTAQGQLLSRLSQTMLKQHMINVDVACVNAIEFVKANPRHEE